MKRRQFLAITGTAPLVLAGVRFAGPGPAAALAQEEATPVPGSSTVFVRQHLELGPYLTDPDGMTLYLFTNDTEAGASVCNGDCAVAWPPFTAEEPLSLPQMVKGELTTITREDGTTQVAYNGIPLYYWAQDQVAGDVTGQGVGDVWYVVSPGQQLGQVATPVATPEGSPVASPAASGEIAVDLAEMTILPSTTVFTVGETYTFVATNVGDFPHEMLIEPAGERRGAPLVDETGREAAIERLEAGATRTLEWTFTEPGTFQLACHIRDHYAMGMVISITVVA